MIACLLAALLAAPASTVAKRVIRADANARELARNGSFTAGDEGWQPWELGYELVDEGRTGRGARCASTDEHEQRGAAQTVELNQIRPLPVVAGGWSRAEGVDGSPTSGYSLYVDIDYADGTHLWGQTANFSVGTHDWEYREVSLVPSKPIARLTFYGLFRGHRGVVWFDDFSLKQLDLPAGAVSFDGVAIERPAELLAPPAEEIDWLTYRLQLRDVAAGSDFLVPHYVRDQEPEPDLLHGTCAELGLELRQTLTMEAGLVRLEGTVRDTTGADRAITITWPIAVDLRGGQWGDDPRTTRPIAEGEYLNPVETGLGATGSMSRYPCAAAWSATRGLAIGYRLDRPQHVRLGYNADTAELFASLDLGLSQDSRTPGEASFSLLLYRFEPEWGFRAALQRYYDLHSELFVKRVTREGIWMPFTDISTVQNHASFGFQFHEGDNNVPFDEAQGIDSFVYIEPMSYWMSMPPETPRTAAAALAQLTAEAADDGHARRRNARAALSSGFHTAAGELVGHLVDAPWSDGALWIANPDPKLPRGDAGWTQADQNQSIVDAAFARADRPVLSGWAAWEAGFVAEPAAGLVGSGAIRCTRTTEAGAGARQSVVLDQTEPRPIVASAWCRAEGVTGEADNDFSLYLDLSHVDGTPLYGQVAPFDPAARDWQRVEVRVEPTKPVRSVSLHLLLRGGHRGTVWFDQVELREEGGENLLANPGFETRFEGVAPQLDGVYIDSFEMAATTPNHRREHWRVMDLPLLYTTAGKQVCAYGFQHTWEFCRAMADDLHGRDRLFFANAVLGRFAAAAPLFDVLGIETDWAPGGEYQPNSDADMLFRRAMCRQKPYCLLLNTDYSRFRPEWVTRYFERCLFYAVFPSFFSHNAADDPYWHNATLYQRDRPLFERVIPVIRELAAAGWEPLTLARGDRDEVWLERYGDPARGAVYLTVFNAAGGDRTTTIELDAELGARESRLLYAGAGSSLRLEGRRLVGRLGPDEVIVVRVR